jgi:hypothetical protein
VLALIFSVALLVLSMAVSQFGPRILYRFVRDGVTQVTIGLFLARRRRGGVPRGARRPRLSRLAERQLRGRTADA